MRFTVFGSSGFIGSHVHEKLASAGFECLTPLRNDSLIEPEDLGHVIYCIGVTADFRERPFDTVRSHVCYLSNLLEKARFSTFTYLSSTRVYQGSNLTTEESSIRSNPTKPNDLYNISKLLGESLCLASGRLGVRVVRLSNVYGKDFSSNNFLPSIIRDACQANRITLQTAWSSTKDYISVSDVVNVLPLISVSGKSTIYNVASGVNISNRILINKLRKSCQCSVSVAKGAPEVKFPRVNIKRLKDEFDFTPRSVLADVGKLVSDFRKVVL